MGLFSKKPNLSSFEVDASSSVPKFKYEGKTYDLDAYVKARELALREKLNSDHIKTVKNYKKAEKEYLKNKNAITYIEYNIGKQLFDGAEKLTVKAIDVINNVPS
ncbi:MAG: hypothetical protein ACLU61_00345 [Lachnospiraceae bacterium]